MGGRLGWDGWGLANVGFKAISLCRFAVYITLLRTSAFIVAVPASSSSSSHPPAPKSKYQSNQTPN